MSAGLKAFAGVDSVLGVPVVVEEVARRVSEHETDHDEGEREEEPEAETRIEEVDATGASWHAFFVVCAWGFAIGGIGLGYYAAAKYVPVARAALREGRATRAVAEVRA